MNNRIKELRKSLNLTQQEFADRIGIKRTTIANYETYRNEPVDSVVSLICREFNVNEKWLRYGEGEMLAQPIDEIAAAVENLLEYDPEAERDPVIDVIIEIVKTYSSLNDESKAVVRSLIKAMAMAIKKEED